MIPTARPNPTKQVRRRELEQFRQSIESWDRRGREAGRAGDVERALLHNGDVASADDWRSALEPVIERYRDVEVPRIFCGDAAFAGLTRS